MSSKYTKFIGPFLIIIVSLLAAYIAFGPMRGGLEHDSIQIAPMLEGSGSELQYGDHPLKTLYRTINKVQKRYLDVTRIDSRSMFIAAMQAVQGLVAKVLVQERTNDMIVRVGEKQKVFKLDDITTLWVLLTRIKDVFVFLSPNLNEDDIDYREVEYAIINEMLQTLDPHSVFLDPSQYRDMKDKTQGKFGGLGIEVSIREGFLTVISPLGGTPAAKAGLEPGDQIVKIDDASTINMPLDDAVNMLRGDPDTLVTIYILRKNWPEPKPITIKRAVIKVESTQTHFLSDKVGYIQIKDFQSNTYEDMLAHLSAFEKKGIRGLVLDLRDCPGGLLESAIEVTDHFVEDGVIVTTAGQSPADRDVRRATKSGEEPKYPLVVLVNRGSASASEIVAGALKNLGRALLIGETTFGKGSVQVLYDFQDGSALKLTTAQYLTPGDESIQSIGVFPHIELLPMLADEEFLDLRVDPGYRESDLNHHFAISTQRNTKNPKLSLSYLIPPPSKDDKAGIADNEEFIEDFEIELAGELVSKMAKGQISGLDSKELAKIVEQRAAAEDKKLVAALGKLGVDWTAGEDSPKIVADTSGRLAVEGAFNAGEEAEMNVTVSNKGTNALYRVLAISKSDFRPLEDRELAFGKIAPGQSLSRTLKFKVPKNTLDRTDDVLWSFETNSDQTLNPLVVRTEVKALPEPRFAYSFQIDDVEKGNGDSMLQPGESVDLVVDIENVGQGASLETYVTISSQSGSDLAIVKGRESLKELLPNGKRRAIFSFELMPDFKERSAVVQLALGDVNLKVYSLKKLKFKVEKPISVVQKKDTAVVMSKDKTTPIYGNPSPDSRIVATLPSGASIEIEAETDRFYRVRLDGERIGWIAKTMVKIGVSGEKSLADIIFNAAPKLTIEKPNMVVRSNTVKIKGIADDEGSIRDVYIFVGDEKVFFKPGKDSKEPSKLAFEADVPLKNGLNFISIVADETDGLFTRKTLTVRRDREDGISYLMPRAVNGEPVLITSAANDNGL